MTPRKTVSQPQAHHSLVKVFGQQSRVRKVTSLWDLRNYVNLGVALIIVSKAINLKKLGNGQSPKITAPWMYIFLILLLAAIENF